jgi:hypothetical protein
MKVLGLLGAKGAGKDTLADHLESLGFSRVSFAEALYEEVAASYKATVAFLNHRETKELPLDRLALKNSGCPAFVEVSLAQLQLSKNIRKSALAFLQTGKASPHTSTRKAKAVLKLPRSPRWILQLWATEFRRKSQHGYDSYWTDIVERKMAVIGDSRPFVVTDVRFVLEVALVDKYAGVLLRVVRADKGERVDSGALGGGTSRHISETELSDYAVSFSVLNIEGDRASLARSFDALCLVL